MLAGGFPTVVQKMATEIDWTEQLGDAMLAQTDDVLDAVQRQRARAAAVGNLETNEAQVVEQTEDSISIAPAEPDVVYVPQYDATTAYTTPYTAPAVIDTGISTSDVLTTGAIAFGSALLVNEIFDDDDDWDDYWDDGPNIDWDEGDFDARPGINVDGDVNIDRERNVDRDRVRNVDRDAVNIDRDKIGDRADRDRGGTWKPDPPRSRRMRARGLRSGRARRAARRPRPPGTRSPRARRGGASSQDIGEKLAKREGRRRRRRRGQAPQHKPPALKGKDSALKAKNLDAKKAKAAANRGDLSKNKGKAKQAAKAHPKAVSKAKAAHKPPQEVGRESLGHEEGQRRQGEGRQGARRQEPGGGRGGGGGGGRRR